MDTGWAVRIPNSQTEVSWDDLSFILFLLFLCLFFYYFSNVIGLFGGITTSSRILRRSHLKKYNRIITGMTVTKPSFMCRMDTALLRIQNTYLATLHKHILPL